MLVFDRIADAAHFEDLLELEALTNPRVREEAGNFRRIRPSDRIAGPGSTPIMASFAYSQASRFCDGTFGVYYAGLDEDTAIAETCFHVADFLADTNQGPIDVDEREYVATIAGTFDDVRTENRPDLYDPDVSKYGAPQAYARALYEADVVDGIAYRSVRNPGGECVVAFRPRVVSDCYTAKYLQLRWDGQRIVAVAEITQVRRL